MVIRCAPMMRSPAFTVSARNKPKPCLLCLACTSYRQVRYQSEKGPSQSRHAAIPWGLPVVVACSYSSSPSGMAHRPRGRTPSSLSDTGRGPSNRD